MFERWQQIVLALPLAALGWLLVPVLVRAQAPPPPNVSPKMSDEPTQRRLVRDFEAPEPAAAEPGEVAEPAASAPARAHVCSTGQAEVDHAVEDAAHRYGLDPCFVIAVMRAESGVRRLAISPKGASGYMQLMPATARRFGVTDIFDTRQNIDGGARYLRFLMDRFGGDMELVLAGYNAGEMAVERYGRRVPPFAETRNYVRSIVDRYSRNHTAGAVLRKSLEPPVTALPPVPQAPPLAWRMVVSFSAGD
jgi:soluble lytic murein transglycosylase-like protein